MMVFVLLLVSLSLTTVYCEIYPYISHMGHTLVNHSYVNISEVGIDIENSVKCITNLQTCCSGAQDSQQGDWYFPDGTRLPFSGQLYLTRIAQQVILSRSSTVNGMVPIGIYQCIISTSEDINENVTMTIASVYIGLYYGSEGNLSVTPVTFHIVSDEVFVITCISTGGPATIVIWTRDSTNVTEGVETVLNDPVTANYTHTLTVTDRLPGLYTCTVTNNKPSSGSASYYVQAPSTPMNVRAIQNSHTSILLSWIPSINATGYKISYDNSNGHSGIIVVNDSLANNHPLNSLDSKSLYSVSIVATSVHLSSGTTTLHINMNVDVTIEPEYIRSPGEDPNTSGPHEFSASGRLNLYCNVRGANGRINYKWTVKWNFNATNCSTCHISTLDKRKIGIWQLYSYHAGNYTCSVSEDGLPAVTTINTFTVNIIGAGLFGISSTGSLPDHGLLISDDDGIVIDCTSNSSNVLTKTGAFTSPYGITYYPNDQSGVLSVNTPFQRPGVIRLHTLNKAPLSVTDQGIYTCTVPDSNGVNITLHVGLYPPGYSDPPTITSLTYENGTLFCVSTDSPATSVSWKQNNTELINNTFSQTVIDRPSSTYSNTLTLGEEIITTLCSVTCSVSNILGYDNKTIYISPIGCYTLYIPCFGITLIGIDEYLGESARIVCQSSVMLISLTIRNGTEILENVHNIKNINNLTVMEIIIPLITDDLQGQEIRCIGQDGNVTSSLSVIIDLKLPDNFLLVETTVTGAISIDAGSDYKISCIVSETTPGLTNAPSAEWILNNKPVALGYGLRISALENSTTVISTLSFTSVHTSHAGLYHCVGSLYSPAVDDKIVINSSTITITITVPVSTPFVSHVLLVAGTMGYLMCNYNLSTDIDTDIKTFVSWRVNGSLINIPSDDGRITSNGTNLLFSKVAPSDAGKYMCSLMLTLVSPYVSFSSPLQSDEKTVTVYSIQSVERLMGRMLSATSIQLGWIRPIDMAGLITGYNLTCIPQLPGIPVHPTLHISSITSSVTVDDLYPGVQYNCSVITLSNYGSFLSLPVSLSTAESVPSGAPEMVTAVAGEREVVFSWFFPPVTQRNGIITGYSLSCSPSPSSSLPQSLPPQSGPLLVTGFSPNTHYSCSLVALNSQGSGPPANMSFTTSEDYSFFQLRLGKVLSSCLEEIGLERSLKLEQINSNLMQVLEQICLECDATLIDEEFFVCYPNSPYHIIYRARIEGTSKSNSSFLVSLIEKWVNRRASIIVTGALLSVDPRCPVIISSVTEPECSLFPFASPEDPKNNEHLVITTATLGCVLALVILLITTFVAVKINQRLCSWNRSKLSINENQGETAVNSTFNEAYQQGHELNEVSHIAIRSQPKEMLGGSAFQLNKPFPPIPSRSPSPIESVYEAISGEK